MSSNNWSQYKSQVRMLVKHDVKNLNFLKLDEQNWKQKIELCDKSYWHAYYNWHTNISAYNAWTTTKSLRLPYLRLQLTTSWGIPSRNIDRIKKKVTWWSRELLRKAPMNEPGNKGTNEWTKQCWDKWTNEENNFSWFFTFW